MDLAARDGFIRSIRKNPHDDTVRLAFADWLDENGDTDVHRATSEFIRVSCRVGYTGNLMPAAAYGWLEGNWKRLMPGALALHTGFDDVPNQEAPRRWDPRELTGRFAAKHRIADRTILWGRHGREVMFQGWAAPLPARPRQFLYFRTWVSFWKGFAVRTRVWHERHSGRVDVRTPLRADQPMLDPRI